MAELGEAYVKVKADTEGFPEDLEAKMKAAAAEATASETFSDMEDNMKKAGKDAGGKMADEAGKEGEKKAKEAGKKTGNGFITGFKSVWGGLTAAFMPGLIAMAVSIGSYVMPAIGALAAAFPAVAAIGVTSMLTLKMATAGVGQSIAALNSGTAMTAAQLKQWRELAPAAQQFALLIHGLKDQLDGLKKGVQQAFFENLLPGLKQGLTALPVIKEGLRGIAGMLGSIGGQVARALGNNKGALGEVLLGIQVILRDVGPMIAGLVPIFLKVAAVALPFVEQLLLLLSNSEDHLGGIVDKLTASGGLADFFTSALTILSALGGALKQVGRLIGDIGDALKTVGGQSLNVLGTVLKQLADFFATDTGQKALQTLVQVLNTALTALAQIIAPLLPVLGKLIIALGPQLIAIVTNLVPPLAKLVGDFANLLPALTPLLGVITPLAQGLGKILDFLAKYPNQVEIVVGAVTAWKLALMGLAAIEAIVDALDPITWIILAVAAIAIAVGLILIYWDKIKKWTKDAWKAVVDFFKGIGDWFVQLGKTIGDWVDGVVKWFQDLPDKISSFLLALPGKIEHWFEEARLAVFRKVGELIGFVIGEFVTFPMKAWAVLKKLPDVFVDMWTAVWKWSTKHLEELGTFLNDWFTSLPGKVAKWFKDLPGKVAGLWEQAHDWVMDRLGKMGKAIGDFFLNLPGNLSKLLINVGKSIGNFVIDGLNAAIDGINKGIDDAHAGSIVGHLPHIPRLAKGALVTSPTVAQIGEAGPEVVIPLNNPGRAQQLAQESGLTQMLHTGLNANGLVVNVYAMLDSGDLIRVIDVRVEHNLDQEAMAMSTGSKSGGF